MHPSLSMGGFLSLSVVVKEVWHLYLSITIPMEEAWPVSLSASLKESWLVSLIETFVAFVLISTCLGAVSSDPNQEGECLAQYRVSAR